jgi:hypothetical protein
MLADSLERIGRRTSLFAPLLLDQNADNRQNGKYHENG